MNKRRCVLQSKTSEANIENEVNLYKKQVKVSGFKTTSNKMKHENEIQVSTKLKSDLMNNSDQDKWAKIPMENANNNNNRELSNYNFIHSYLQNLNKVEVDFKCLVSPLEEIYLKFINSDVYLNSIKNKDEFYSGVGLYGIGIEEKMYKRRKKLEESLKRGFRLRPNPKPTKLFDGTIINRPRRIETSSMNKQIIAAKSFIFRKNRYNVFNIGKETLNRKNKTISRKPVKKRPPPRPSKVIPLKSKEKAGNEQENSNENSSSDIESTSIALTKPKRQLKVPQLEFKYCYDTCRYAKSKKMSDTESTKYSTLEKVKEECKQEESVQFKNIDNECHDAAGIEEKKEKNMEENMKKNKDEKVESESSSVIEISPPHQEVSENTSTDSNSVKDSPIIKRNSKPKKVWKPKNRALNLLDKLRLGLQCTIIQTENDIIIQNLSPEDLGTLQSRLQGLANFKNIEAEYDKNGQETARATIDRKALNIPLKSYENSPEGKNIGLKRYFDSLKRKVISKSVENLSIERKKPTLSAKPLNIIKPDKSLAQVPLSAKVEEVNQNWMRSKGRSVKKVRKLYTQTTNTPNILSRSQISQRCDNLPPHSSFNGQTQIKSQVCPTVTNVLPFSYPSFRMSIAGTDTTHLIHHQQQQQQHHQPAQPLTSVAFYPKIAASRPVVGNIASAIVDNAAESKVNTSVPVQQLTELKSTEEVNECDDDVKIMNTSESKNEDTVDAALEIVAEKVSNNIDTMTTSGTLSSIVSNTQSLLTTHISPNNENQKNVTINAQVDKFVVGEANCLTSQVNIVGSPTISGGSIAKSNDVPTTSISINTISSSNADTASISNVSVTTTVTTSTAIPVTATICSNRSGESVTPATSLSASQLLMLKKGSNGNSTGTNSAVSGDRQCSPNHNAAFQHHSGTPSIVQHLTSGPDQILGNQILKPLKKQQVSTKSPAKIEIDDDENEVDFELPANATTGNANLSSSTSSSLTTPSKGVAVVSVNSSPVNSFISKPLIQSSSQMKTHVGVTGSNDTKVSHSSPVPGVRYLQQQPPAPAQCTAVLLSSPSKQSIPATSLVNRCSPLHFQQHQQQNIQKQSTGAAVPHQHQQLQMQQTPLVLHQSNINNSNNNNCASPTLSTGNAGGGGGCVKIKHRKWTHNFLKSSNINFREVFCGSNGNGSNSAGVVTVPPNSNSPLLMQQIVIPNLVKSGQAINNGSNNSSSSSPIISAGAIYVTSCNTVSPPILSSSGSGVTVAIATAAAAAAVAPSTTSTVVTTSTSCSSNAGGSAMNSGSQNNPVLTPTKSSSAVLKSLLVGNDANTIMGTARESTVGGGGGGIGLPSVCNRPTLSSGSGGGGSGLGVAAATAAVGVGAVGVTGPGTGNTVNCNSHHSHYHYHPLGWASKYLVGGVGNNIQDSKIKWQVSGSIQSSTAASVGNIGVSNSNSNNGSNNKSNSSNNTECKGPS